MKRLLLAFALTGILAAGQTIEAQDTTAQETVLAADSMTGDLTVDEMVGEEDLAALEVMALEEQSLHQQLKTKFVEGSPFYMSLVAIVLVLGLAFCIERIIYLTLAEIKARKLLSDIDARLEKNDLEGAKTLCRDTRGLVASICYQGLLHAREDMNAVERTVVNYGSVQSAKLERGCSWIRLFIAMAPSLGFLGTVIGMVMAFDQIQEAGDISPTIVAEGMKVALITTIFGIIVALVLQLFYNFILVKIEHLTVQMEDAAITLMDILSKHKERQNAHTPSEQQHFI